MLLRPGPAAAHLRRADELGHAAVESAARHAARTISIARDPDAAAGVAEDDAAITVRLGSALCESMDFDPVVVDGEVTVTVTCQVDLSELALLPVPGTTVQATATEVIDRHREGGRREAPAAGATPAT